MTATVLGVLALAVLFWAMWAKKFPRFNVWLGLLAGLTLSGGLLYNLSRRGAALLESVVSSASVALVGASVTLVIGVLVCLELWRVTTKRGGGKPHRVFHPLLAFLAPVLLVAAGGVFADLAGLLQDGADTVGEVGGSVLDGDG